MGQVIKGKMLVTGEATGQILVSKEPLSFWGGYDFLTGEIIDRRHPLSGQNAAGKLLVVPYSKGSSTTTAVLLEAVRTGKAPAALLTTRPDRFFALASITADELYGKPIPILVLDDIKVDSIQNYSYYRLETNGSLVEIPNF